MKYVYSKSDFPTRNHFAVLVYSRHYIEGDERSKTNPGHGYPAHYDLKLDYIAFDSEQELIVWVEKNQTANYSIIQTTPRIAETKLLVTIK